MTDEWFRSPEWTEQARAEFGQRLRRARPTSRAQYLRIKGLALAGAGNNDGAIELLRRVTAEYPDEWIQVAPAYESLGALLRAEGDLAGAEAALRSAIEASPTLNATTGEVRIALGEVVLESGASRADEVAQLLAESRDDGQLNTTVFRWNVLSARLAALRGDAEAARIAAEGALALVDAPPQFARHPTVGIARPSDELLAELERLARPSRAGAGAKTATSRRRLWRAVRGSGE